ncbi:MAG: flagellar basal body L-ring protein FlgH [Xanthomonadales bacterium]|nr:flagellar basal body L-ring protein FlgH [Xanthomonadales bacterium]
MRKAALFLVLAPALVLAGCNSPSRIHPDYAAMEPIPEYPEPPALAPTGAILHTETRNLVLFEDLRARQVGDILTVVLAESTDAAKSSDTSVDKSNSNSIDNPLLAGKFRTFEGSNTLDFGLGSENSFGGESASNQSNKLTGSITVTVAQVMPGGNLYIQGEKWIEINQGNEYIRLRGIVRPVDILSDNSILSTQVADARISYSGTGATADANRMGWLSRFFVSPFWPF